MRISSAIERIRKPEGAILLKIAKTIVIIMALLMIIFQTQSEAALAIDPAAVRAVDYQTRAIRDINNYLDFYKIGLKFIGPNPVAGYSVVRALGRRSQYDDIFSRLEHNRKSQDKDKEQLWEELLDMKEKNSIRTLNRALDSSGKALFGNRWPRVPVPGAVGEETFRMQPDVFKYIVPAKTGIIIGSPSGFDDSMQEYLKSMGMFYPILTFTIPIPDDIQKSKFSDAIYVKLQQNIPGAVVRNGRINITLLPDLDSLNHLIYKTREALVSGRG